MENEKLYGDDFIEIEYDSVSNWLYVNWQNKQNYDSIVNGGEKMLQFLKEKQCSKVLNDNRLVVDEWGDATEYTEKDWFPRMVGAGLKYFAWIYSPDIFSQFTANNIAAMQESNIVRVFKNINDGKNWLKSV